MWLCLEEKKVPYRVERVNMSCYGDKPPEFRRMQPSGQIPVAVIDGTVYGQSNDIVEGGSLLVGKQSGRSFSFVETLSFPHKTARVCWCFWQNIIQVQARAS